MDAGVIAWLPPVERQALLALAREALESSVRGWPMPVAPADELFARRAGAFVTLTEAGELRGCIGRPEPRDALWEVIVECAAAAALEDPRFTPVSPDELSRIRIEVSVLTPVRPVTDLRLVEVGRHGLVISQGGLRGLLLPQVAVEWGWTRDEFLSHTCRKAGLPHDAWQRGAEVFAFEAEIFSEGEP